MSTLSADKAEVRSRRIRGRRLAEWTPSVFQFLADVVAMICSVLPYYWLKFFSGWFETDTPAHMASNPLLIVFTVVGLSLFWIVLFWFAGLYKNWYVRSPFEELFSVVKLTIVGCFILFAAILWDDNFGSSLNSRLIILVYWLLVSLSVMFGRLTARAVQRRLRERGIIRIPAILLGCADKVADLYRSLKSAPALGYLPLGVVLQPADPKGENAERDAAARDELRDLDDLGSPVNLGKILEDKRPREVLMAIGQISHDELLDLASTCSAKNVQVKIVPDLYEIFSGQARTMQIYGTPLIEVSPQLMKPWEEVAKRLLDILVSLGVLVVGLPLWLAVAIVIRLDSPGPILYSQTRVGRDGRNFTLHKFRSMYTDAEKHGPQWATMNDPRVSRVGRFIRKTHIDEFPQFWNVLRGEMSMVGPRPERPYYVEKFTEAIPYYPRRLKVRPGITGWHQVKYVTYDETLKDVRERLRYDFFYIENMSFKLDLEILARTVFRVLKGHGQA